MEHNDKNVTAVQTPEVHYGEGPAGEAATLLDEVQKLLDEGRPETALERIGKSKLRSPWVTNATAVCQMRLGKQDLALRTLRGLVITNGVILRGDAPLIFRINFATALLLQENVSGATATLGEIQQEDHPAVKQLREVIARWKAQMNFCQKFLWAIGIHPSVPVPTDFPAGWLR